MSAGQCARGLGVRARHVVELSANLALTLSATRRSRTLCLTDKQSHAPLTHVLTDGYGQATVRLLHGVRTLPLCAEMRCLLDRRHEHDTVGTCVWFRTGNG